MASPATRADPIEFAPKTRWRSTIGRKFDVQFSDLGAEYPFGLALFDNAHVRHAFHMGALKLKFAKKSSAAHGASI